MDLPRHPGRSRMLAYGEYVRQRNRNIDGRPRVTRHNNRFTYEILSNLQDEPVGLTLRELIDCSRVCVCGRQVFCCICQDTIQTNDILRRLTCQHEFHMSCIDMWFLEKNRCPLCSTGMRRN